MSDLVHVTIVGRLTRDAELRDAGGQQLCKFRLAATPYKSEAMFIDVAVWGRRGEALVQYLTKGSQVVAVGELSQRKYEHNGEKRISLDLNASSIALVGSREERAATESDNAAEDGEEPIPF